jgi:hypothetical protein
MRDRFRNPHINGFIVITEDAGRSCAAQPLAVARVSDMNFPLWLYLCAALQGVAGPERGLPAIPPTAACAKGADAQQSRTAPRSWRRLTNLLAAAQRVSQRPAWYRRLTGEGADGPAVCAQHALRMPPQGVERPPFRGDSDRVPCGGVGATEPGARSEGPGGAPRTATAVILGRVWVVETFYLRPGDPQDDRRHDGPARALGKLL